MKELSRDELVKLFEARDGLRISLYAPMKKAGPETRKNPIRFKNQVQRADELLAERQELPPEEREAILEPLRAMVETRDFWEHQGNGLAVFRSRDDLVRYRLPIAVKELAVVGHRYHVKPLLPLLAGDGRHYVLALSQKLVRLFEATRDDVHEIELEDVPTQLEDVVGHEVEETHRQVHSSSPGGQRGPGIHHGQGGGEDDQDREVRKFLAQVDRGIEKHLADRQAPLVLASVDSLAAVYRELSDHPHLLDDNLSGNPDELPAQTLHERSWQLVEPVFRRVQEEAASRYRELAGTGKTAHRLEETLLAAHDGRVDTLFVALDAHRWGRYDPEAREVEEAPQEEPGTEDLIDATAVETLLHSGEVYAVDAADVPGDGGQLAAILRY